MTKNYNFHAIQLLNTTPLKIWKLYLKLLYK
jgi:hypothetical protein